MALPDYKALSPTRRKAKEQNCFSIGSHLLYDNKYLKIYKGPFLHHIAEYPEYKTKKEKKSKIKLSVPLVNGPK